MTFRTLKSASPCPAAIVLSAMVFCSVSLAHAAPPTIAPKEVVQAFIGSSDVKFLFISSDDSNAYFIDYSEADPSLRLLEGMTGANLIDISPDGNWLTYQTGKPIAGGIEGPCATACTTSVWIRPFAAVGTPVRIAENGYVPRFVVSAVDTPTIIFSTAVDCPRDSFPPVIHREVPLCFKSGMVLGKKAPGGTVTGATDTIFRGGSYYGGISYDRRYLCTGWPGGVSTFMLDLQNSSSGPQMMHSIPVVDTLGQASYYNPSACNMSRSPSRIFTNTMLYYDLGQPASDPPDLSNPLWGNWEFHSALFISRMGAGRGELLRYYGTPPDQTVTESSPDALGKCIQTEWTNPEWSNHPYFATAALKATRLWKPELVYKQIGKGEAVYAINLKDRSVLRLVSTTDTAYAATFSAASPALWVKVPTGFTEDPTWLSAPDPDKTVPVRKFRPSKAGTAQLSLSSRTIVSDKPLSGVLVFSAAGRLVWKAGTAGISRSAIVLPALRPGAYFAQVQFPDAQSQTLRWVVR